MVDPAPQHIDIESFVAGMRPPTDDDVPLTLDWQPLDTQEALVSYGGVQPPRVESAPRSLLLSEGDGQIQR